MNCKSSLDVYRIGRKSRRETGASDRLPPALKGSLLLHPKQFLLLIQIVQIILFLDVGRAAVVAEGDVAAAGHIGDQRLQIGVDGRGAISMRRRQTMCSRVLWTRTSLRIWLITTARYLGCSLIIKSNELCPVKQAYSRFSINSTLNSKRRSTNRARAS